MARLVRIASYLIDSGIEQLNEAQEEIPGEPPHLVIGATAHPMADDPDAEIAKIRDKMEAGADFFQSQLVYMPDRLERFFDRMRASDLPRWPRIIVGVGPFKHLRMAIHMRDKVWGVEVPDDGHGVLQDMHWAGGSFGYFPTYSLGNVISVQIWERLKDDLGDLDQSFERGEFDSLREWLTEHLYVLGRRFTPQETIERVTGSRMDARPYLRYLREKLAPQPA